MRMPLMRELSQAGRSVHSWFQHSVGGRCRVSPPALSPKVGEVPRRCPLRPVCPPALWVHPPVSIGDSHVLVQTHLEEKSRGLGVGKFPLRSALSF